MLSPFPSPPPSQLPLPGELYPRVVRLEALWSEQPSDGIPRMMARCTRFYRPQVCV